MIFNRNVKYSSNINRKFTMLFLAILVCVQFGYSTNVSVATFGVMLLFLRSAPLRLDVVPVLAFIVVSLLSLLSGFITVGMDGANILQQMRILFVGVMYVVLLGSSGLINLDYKFFTVTGVILATSVMLLQTLANLKGFPLVVPDYYFSLSDDGALAYKALQKSFEVGYTLIFRQSMTYSEPSYFGLILISLNFLSLATYGKTRNGYILFSMLLLASLVSGTLYGQLGLILSMLFWGASIRKLPSTRQSIFIIFLIGIMIFLFFFLDTLRQRLELVIFGSDISAITRIINPLKLIYHNFTNAPFGVPLSVAYNYYLHLGFYGVQDDPPLHNAFYNLFIAYGYLGFLVLLILLTKMKSKAEAFFFIIVMCQNGTIFTFDKLFIVAFTIQLSRRILQHKYVTGAGLKRGNP